MVNNCIIVSDHAACDVYSTCTWYQTYNCWFTGVPSCCSNVLPVLFFCMSCRVLHRGVEHSMVFHYHLKKTQTANRRCVDWLHWLKVEAVTGWHFDGDPQIGIGSVACVLSQFLLLPNIMACAMVIPQVMKSRSLCII